MCGCPSGWSGPACDTSDLPLFNCSLSGTPLAKPTTFVNPSANPLQLLSWSRTPGSTSCATAPTVCAASSQGAPSLRGLVPPHSSVRLWLPDCTTDLQAVYWSATGAAGAVGERENYTRTGDGNWQPSLTTIAMTQAVCLHDSDCASPVSRE